MTIAIQTGFDRKAVIWSKKFLKYIFIKAGSLVLVIVLWEFLAWLEIWNPVFLPAPSVVFKTIIRLVSTGVLPLHLYATVFRLIYGFFVAVAVGLPLGLFMGYSRVAEDFFSPIINVLMPIPAIAWIPMFILWFGLGDTATVMLISFASFFPITYNAYTGVKSVDRVLVRAATSMCAGRLLMMTRVLLPGAFAMIITGLRMGMARAWRALVAGEMIAASTYGLGYMIFDAREFLATDVMVSGIIVIGVGGLLLENVLFRIMERKTVEKWGTLREVGE